MLAIMLQKHQISSNSNTPHDDNRFDTGRGIEPLRFQLAAKRTRIPFPVVLCIHAKVYECVGVVFVDMLIETLGGGGES